MTTRLLRDEKGFALFATMMGVILLFSIGLAIYQLMDMELRINLNHRHGAQALYLADAGVQMAIHQLQMEPNWRGGYRNYPLGDGVIQQVVVQHRPNQMANLVRIESQGEVEGVRRRVRVDLEKVPVPGSNVFQTNNLILSPGINLSLQGDGIHHGNMTINVPGKLTGHLTVGGNAHIDEILLEGSISATGNITLGKNAAIRGDLASGKGINYTGELDLESRLYPDMDIDVEGTYRDINFPWYEKGMEIHSEENQIRIDDLVDGISYSHQDLIILNDGEDGAYSGTKILAVAGTLIIDGNFIARNPEQDSVIFIGERVIVSNRVQELWGAILAQDEIQILGLGEAKQFYGTLRAPILALPPGKISLVYRPLAGGELIQYPQTIFKQIRWQEIMPM